MKRLLFVAIGSLLGLAASVSAADLEVRSGDHICIVGGTMAERMQHYGWLETRLHARFAKHELTFRNLAYSGDEIDGFRDPNKRLRSRDFGSHDQWLAGSAPCPQPGKLSPRDMDKVRENRFELTNTKADIIFAFYGYNESAAGEAGLPAFKENADAFVKHTLSQKYNGKSAPRLVLFSPVAQELITDPNLPTAAQVAARNRQVRAYADALAEVAKANGVWFVDIFNATAQQSEPGKSLTINGIHQNDLGDSLIAAACEAGLFPNGPTFKRDGAALEKLRTAVKDKNFYWFHRYRVTDGYSTYGDRAFLKFSEGPGGYGNGLSNYSVGQRELDVLDVKTSNRDRVIWATAQGKTMVADDSNLPALIPVITNKPGPLEGGKHIFQSGEGAISAMTVHKGMKVNLFADETMFPELVNPVQMAFDTKGRLWVAAWESYPHWKPTEPMVDKLLILEDTNNDGRADKCITFAGDIHNPTGFEFWGGGVLVAQGPDLLFLKDTNGDDRYDIKERVVHGLDTADTHHTANSFTLDPGGAVYFQEGTFHHSQVETPWGAPRRVANGAVFRFEPRAQKFDVYVSYGFANPHGHAFDKWGQDIVVDGTGAVPYHGTLFSGHLDFPTKHSGTPTVYKQRTRPCPAIEYLSSSHFPEEHRGNLLVGNVIGFQGILQYTVQDQDSSLGATEVEPILSSSDPNFRPADIEVAPDGSIYFTDWQNPIIGHMQHNLRDPSRDRTHGRVYRVTYEGRPLVKPAPIAGQPIDSLLNLLKEKDDRVRYRARTELSGRPTADVMTALAKWTASLDKNDPEFEHRMLESLWVHQHHNVVNPALLDRMLTSPDFRARAAAVRVLVAWRDRLPNSLDLAKRAAGDVAGKVRLEAVRAASFFGQAEAVEVLLIAAELPTDLYIEYVSRETLKTLNPLIERAKADGRPLAFSTDAGLRFALKGLSNEQLLKEKRTRAVYMEMLYRSGLQDAQRREAIVGLAKLDNKSELQVVMDSIKYMDEKQTGVDTALVFDLVRQLTGRGAAELSSARAELEKLAASAKQPLFRQIGYVSLINIDGNVDRAWSQVSTNARQLEDLVNAMPLISDPSVRATLYEKVEPLVHGLPVSLGGGKAGKGTIGRFVRIELPRKGTLTLAEVEVLSGGRNVAAGGRASQKNTAFGGDAKRAIDGNKNPTFAGGGQTHTEEETGNPWWEVDLGGEMPIDQISIYNRTDGDLGNRLSGFTLKLLDNSRREVFVKTGLAAPKPKADFALEGGGPEAILRRAAMNALTHVRGQEGKTFVTLAKFVTDDVDRVVAVRALQRLPRQAWPADQAPSLVNVLLAAIRKTPAAERTSDAALDIMEFADALTTLLPADQAKKIRAELGELGVRVIKIGTVFEKMSFDKDIVAVKAGKPVEFVLENSDLMPHNFVILNPGSLEEIGLLAEASAQQPAFAARQFVPQSKHVLAASGLLQPRDSQRVSFNVPKKPGVYPYVCTYPGHWRRMYGALYVVEDLDDYLANPEAYLVAHKIEAADAMLKDRRPRTEWKYEDLADAVKGLFGGHDAHASHTAPGHEGHLAARSHGNGRQMFKVANCVGCHKLEGVGNVFGPDLTKRDPKIKDIDLVKEILDPSAQINEKFQTNVFELGSGKVITGLVIEEGPDGIKLIENPLAKAEPIVIKRGDVVGRQRSKVSIMPKGLLDKLTRDEILDLLAYVAAGGDKNHAIYKSGSAAGAKKGDHGGH